MRFLVEAIGVLSLSGLASASAYPFGQAVEAGLLSEDEIAQHEAIRADGRISNSFPEIHKREAVEAVTQGRGKRAENGLLPGLTLPNPILPLGGGLCK